MSQARHPVVGTIRVEPFPRCGADTACDDSTLESLLKSFACRDALYDEPQREDSICLLVSARLCRIQAAAEGHVTVRANLAQLLVELQTEYEGLVQQIV
jgi:hypothetical protein